MSLLILGYKATIGKGFYGWYCNFFDPILGQDHWQITGLIARHYNILQDPDNIISDINWKPLFDHINFDKVNYYNCRFPEFGSKEDLKRFAFLLNTNFNKDVNFIDIKSSLDIMID